jgi:hypothetical protein
MHITLTLNKPAGGFAPPPPIATASRHIGQAPAIEQSDVSTSIDPIAIDFMAVDYDWNRVSSGYSDGAKWYRNQ